MADSWSMDAHKTLNAPYDCGIVLCKDKDALMSAMQATGSYIIYGDRRDGMLYTPEMSRRARSVELWATLAALGKDGIEALVDELCFNAGLLAEKLSDASFEVLNNVVFNQIIVRYKKNDEYTNKLLEAIQKSSVLWCGPSKFQGMSVIRISVCSWVTDETDIDKVAKAFIKAKKDIDKG